MEKEIRKKNHLPLLTIAFLLFILGLITMVVLFSRILYFSGRNVENVIPLISTASPKNKDSGGHYETSGSVVLGQPENFDNDGNAVWKNTTTAEIFRCSYDNENGELTVMGGGDSPERVIAPGTSNDYKFTIQNTSSVPLDYDLCVEAEAISSGHEIPLTISLRADNSGYLAGSDKSGTIEELNGVQDRSVLGGGRCNYYTLSWAWPFDQENDEYDTMLGDLSVTDTITVRVEFKTTASLNADPGNKKYSEAGDLPKTGDNSPYTLLMIVMIAAFIAAVLFFLVGGKRTRDDKEDKERS